jgi:hypothetical protein
MLLELLEAWVFSIFGLTPFAHCKIPMMIGSLSRAECTSSMYCPTNSFPIDAVISSDAGSNNVKLQTLDGHYRSRWCFW